MNNKPHKGLQAHILFYNYRVTGVSGTVPGMKTLKDGETGNKVREPHTDEHFSFNIHSAIHSLSLLSVTYLHP